MYQVYILQNQQAKTYIGLTQNIEERLTQHNHGESTWSKKYLPWHLYWLSRPMNLTQARQLENLMKKQKGGNGLKKLMELYVGS